MGRNPAGIFDVEMCEQMTASAPTRPVMGLAILLMCIVTHGFQNRNPTFDWFPAPPSDFPDLADVKHFLPVAACSTIVL